MSASAREDTYIEAGSTLAQIGTELSKRHGGLVGCIAYGSCLRSDDPFDGLVDFYLIVESYRKAYGPGLAACFNWLLPPNVYYAEVPLKEGLARVKYSLLSLADFERGCKRRFESYVWGRLAQPVGLHGFAQEGHGERIQDAFKAAAMRLINETLPLMQGEFTSRDLWTLGISKSYATELRAERAGRMREVFEHAPGHYQALTALVLEEVSGVERLEGDRHEGERFEGDRWRVRTSATARSLGRAKWLLRGLLGKLLSLLRLLKAYFTFRDGIDYLAWKLSRHSGQAIEVPAKVRRYPLIFGWPFFARLYREGVFK